MPDCFIQAFAGYGCRSVSVLNLYSRLDGYNPVVIVDRAGLCARLRTGAAVSGIGVSGTRTARSTTVIATAVITSSIVAAGRFAEECEFPEYGRVLISLTRRVIPGIYTNTSAVLGIVDLGIKADFGIVGRRDRFERDFHFNRVIRAGNRGFGFKTFSDFRRIE
ncbi:hypothetical protein D3C73_1302150 [compost metagenome]